MNLPWLVNQFVFAKCFYIPALNISKSEPIDGHVKRDKSGNRQKRDNISYLKFCHLFYMNKHSAGLTPISKSTTLSVRGCLLDGLLTD